MRDALAQLTRKLSDPERRHATEWWRALSSHERETITVLARPSRRGLVCQFVDDPIVDAEPDDLYEYFVNHELELFPTKTFHICTAEPEARSAVEAGLLPASFRCPRAAHGCPMRRLIRAAAGNDVRIALSSGGTEHG